MTQVSNNINFTAKYPIANNPQQIAAAPVQSVDIKNGSEKSMNALAWAGNIAAASLALAGIGVAVAKGKGIDAKYIDMDKLAKEGIATLNDEGVANIGRVSKFINQIGSDGKTVNSARIIQDIDGKKVKTLVRNGRRISQETITPIAGKRSESVREIFNENNEVIKVVKNRKEVVSINNPNGGKAVSSTSKKIGNNGVENSYTFFDDAGVEKFKGLYKRTQDGRIEAKITRTDADEIIDYKKLPFRGDKKVKPGSQEIITITRNGNPIKVHIERKQGFGGPFKVVFDGSSKAVKYVNQSKFREDFLSKTGFEYDELLLMIKKIVTE